MVHKKHSGFLQPHNILFATEDREIGTPVPVYTNLISAEECSPSCQDRRTWFGLQYLRASGCALSMDNVHIGGVTTQISRTVHVG